MMEETPMRIAKDDVDKMVRDAQPWRLTTGDPVFVRRAIRRVEEIPDRAAESRQGQFASRGHIRPE